MRFFFFIFLLLSFSIVQAQDPSALESQQVAWFVDDFSGDVLRSTWKSVAGNWKVEGENLVTTGAGENFVTANDFYIMRSKPHTIEVRIKGGNGGMLFCMEDQNTAANCHTVQLKGNEIISGYLNYLGELVVTRRVEYIVPSTPIRLRVVVDPIKKTYEVFLQDRAIALENLRYRSGYSACYASKAGIQFDYLQVVGDGRRDVPPMFLKSNELQVDHLSYMTLLEENMIIVNPIIGIVQRVNSIGGFILEIPVQGPKSFPRGVCIGPEKKLYVVDGGEHNVRVYNFESQLELIVSGSFKDPRGVAVDEQGTMYILDPEGIHLFSAKGDEQEIVAKGTFKDPRNIYMHGNFCYVTDAGQGKLFVLNRKSFVVERTITENLVKPWDVCVENKSGDIYVADPGAAAVFQYDKTGMYIDKIDPLTVNGFISPRAVRVREGNIIVGDLERILIFKKEALSVRPSLQIGMTTP